MRPSWLKVAKFIPMPFLIKKRCHIPFFYYNCSRFFDIYCRNNVEVEKPRFTSFLLTFHYSCYPNFSQSAACLLTANNIDLTERRACKQNMRNEEKICVLMYSCLKIIMDFISENSLEHIHFLWGLSVIVG